MRYHQITEEAPSMDIRNMISTIALSLISSGREEVNIQSLVNEIKKRTGIDVPYNVLMDILNELPYVQDSDSGIVKFGSNDTEVNNPEKSSEEQVRDMATKAASKSIE